MILPQQIKKDGTFLKTNQGREKGKDSDEGQKRRFAGENVVFSPVHRWISGGSHSDAADFSKGKRILYQNGGRCCTALCSADVDP